MPARHTSTADTATHAALDDTLGGRIVSARETVGLTTAQLARRLGVKSVTLQNWENDRSEPRSNKLFMLAGLLNVTPAWLINGSGEAPGNGDGDPMPRDDMRQQLIALREQTGKIGEKIDAIIKQLD